MSSIEITPELMAGFLDEAPEYLDMLDSGLMDFESIAAAGSITIEDAENYDRMNEMFRAAHSLKGLAAAFGFEKVKDLTHHMETLFDHVRMGQRELTADAIEILFTVFDRLKALIEELSGEADEEVQIADMVEELKRILESPVGPDASSPSPSRSTESTMVPSPGAPMTVAVSVTAGASCTKKSLHPWIILASS